jgi:Zn-dependent protease
MSKNSLRIGRIFGIPVNIDPSWLLIFVWVTWSLAGNYFPQMYPGWSTGLAWGMGIATSLLFFTSVLAHEIAHSLVARANGMPVHDITLFLFGGVAQIAEEPATPRREFLMAVVGPLTSLAIGGLSLLISALTRTVSQPLSAMTMFLGGINLTLGVFNLIPGFPLDGGRVLRSLLWAARKDLVWATRWASRVGQFVAYSFILIGIWRGFSGDWIGGLWIAFIGLFLDNAARTSYLQMTLRNMLDGHVAREAMSSECPLVPPQLTVDVLVDQFVIQGGRRCFTVGAHGDIVGLLTIHNLRQVPKDQWPTTRVADVAIPLEKMRVVGPDTPLWDALQQMTAEGVNQLPVVDDGKLLGMLSRDQLLTYVRNKSELGI